MARTRKRPKPPLIAFMDEANRTFQEAAKALPLVARKEQKALMRAFAQTVTGGSRHLQSRLRRHYRAAEPQFQESLDRAVTELRLLDVLEEANRLLRSYREQIPTSDG